MDNTQADLTFRTTENIEYSVAGLTITFPSHSSPPTPRCLHSAVIYFTHIYVFGGCYYNKKTLPANELFYKLDLETYAWQLIDSTPGPSQRQSHTAAIHSHSMFIFGGKNEPNIYDDLWSYNFATNAWKKWDIKFKPKPRFNSTLISLRNKYLFLFGGIDQYNLVCTNSFLFDPAICKWNELKLFGNDCYRCFPALSSDTKVHIFGGSKNAQLIGNFSKELHEFSIDENRQEIASLQICPPQISPSPPGMIHHGMVALGSNLLLLLGGFIEVKTQGMVMNSLVWVFDISEATWRMVQLNTKIPPKAKFSINIQENNIYIFGGVTLMNETCNDLIVLSFPVAKKQQKPAGLTQPSELSQQQQHLTQPQQSQLMLQPQLMTQKQVHLHVPILKNPVREAVVNERVSLPKRAEQILSYPAVVSTTFIGAIASTQKHPFSAFSHIVDCAVSVNAEYIRMALRKRPERDHLRHLHFQFSGRLMTNQQFMDTLGCHQSRNPTVSDFGVKMKLGGFRLGKTILFISRNQNFIGASLMSLDTSIAPDSDRRYVYFVFIQHLQSKSFVTHEGGFNKMVIINFLLRHFDNPEQVLSLGSCYSLYIFDPKILPTSENELVHELSATHDNDIWPFVDPKKVEFLDNRGYGIKTQPDISLRIYLGLLYLIPTIKVYIGDSKEPVSPVNYIQRLRSQAQTGVLTHLPIDVDEPALSLIEAYTVTDFEGSFVPDNYGLLVYAKGRLLKRFNFDFGDLFENKFFRNKYRTKRMNLNRFLGIVDFNPALMRVNLLETDMDFDHLSMTIWSSIKLSLKMEDAKLRPLTEKTSVLLGMGTLGNEAVMKEMSSERPNR